jgi:hypothetical protein
MTGSGASAKVEAIAAARLQVNDVIDGIDGIEFARDGCDVSALGARSGSWRRLHGFRFGSGESRSANGNGGGITCGRQRAPPLGKSEGRGKQHAVE